MKTKCLSRRSVASALLAGFLALFIFSSSSYASPAIDFTETTVDWNDGNNYALGWSFTANLDLVVDSLGVYAAPDYVSGERTFTQSHEVGIFDAGGNLIAATTVNAADPLTGLFRWHALDSAVTLTSGSTYYLLAAMGADQYTWDPSGFSVSSNITFGQNFYAMSDILVFATDTDGPGTLGYFGPNLNAAPVPLPAAFWLLGSGLAGIVALRKKIQG